LTTGELYDPLGEKPEILEEPIGEEEEETLPHTYNKAKNRNEGASTIRKTNGDARIKNISPPSLPHFHG